MDFDHILDRAIEMLQRRGRLTYRTLKRQFDLDDNAWEDLKAELLYSQPQVMDDKGRGLAWTGGPATHERRFQSILRVVTSLLKDERRLTYRTLKYLLALNDEMLAEIREELVFRQLAIDVDGKGLVWAGATPPSVYPAISQQNTTTSPAPPAIEPHDSTTNDLEEVAVEPQISEPESMRNTPEAERRQLTVMFCDLVGSTDLSGRLDPEDLREVVRAYQETATEVIHRYEGHIAQYLGDGLLIYFGYPVAHEDDAQRAGYTGLGIVEAMSTLNTRLMTDHDVELAVRIGIHTGPVVVGEMGSGERLENLALGETPNIAARLEGLAPNNSVVMSPVTAQLVERAFVLEELGLHPLKGVVEPLKIYRVLKPRDIDNDPHQVRRGDAVDILVGRDEEIGLLLRRWEQVKEGLGQAVLISGEAGIGKSSLVATVRHHAVEAGGSRIPFRCSPYHHNSALYPVIEQAQRVLQFQPGDTSETRFDKLERMLSRYRRPLEDVVPLYADLLSVPVPAGRYPDLNLSPQQQRQQTQDAMVGWLLEEAERQPTLVIWEDLHWADPSTLELLGLALEQAPTVPMLHVLTYRSEFEPPWPMRSHLTPIALNRLERSQVEALIANLSGGKALPPEVIEHVVSKTDGVPLYVEELTKMLLESDLLQDQGEHVVLTGPLNTLAIPDTLQDALMARLDQMNTAKEMAQTGAVLGREFSYDMLRAITPTDDTALQMSLTQLVEAELLYQRGRPPQSSYMFKHALIQDAAYASLLKSTRQQIHQRIAKSLETTFPELAAAQPELVAHHYTEASCEAQAASYWYIAGRFAAQRSAHIEAIAHLTQGLDTLERTPETEERYRLELDLQLGLGRSFMATKGFVAVEAEQAYTRTWELSQRFEALAHQTMALSGLRRVATGRGDTKTARELSEKLITLARAQNDTHLLLEAHYSLGVALQHVGEVVAAHQQFEQGIHLDQPSRRDVRPSLKGIEFDSNIGNRIHSARMLWIMGYPDQAVQRDDEALALAELANPYSQGFALLWSATLYSYLRETQMTLQRTETLIALARQHAFESWVVHGTIRQGWARGMLGDEEIGLSMLRETLSGMHSVENYLPYYLYLLAEIYGTNGQPEKGLQALAKSLSIMAMAGDQLCEGEVYRLQGELLQRAEEHAQKEVDATPETCFQQALDIARHQQAKSFELRAAMSLARLWQSQGKCKEAYDLLGPVYGWFTEGFDTADLVDANMLLQELSESQP